MLVAQKQPKYKEKVIFEKKESISNIEAPLTWFFLTRS